MSDLVISAVAGLGVLGCALGATAIARRNASGSVLVRLGQAPARSKRNKTSRKALLAGLADRVRPTRMGSRLESYVSRAHPALAFSDAVAMVCSAIIAGALVGTILFAGGPLVLLTAAAGPVVLDRVLLRIGGRRAARVEQQLPEALALQATALRAGRSLEASLRSIAVKTAPPLGEECERAGREIDLGRPLDTVLRSLSARTASRDVDLWVTAMVVHRSTGGDLTAILDSLEARMRERVRMRAELRALTAQGRLSGLVVGAAPLAFFLLLTVTSRDQMKVLYTTPTGLLILLIGLTLMAAGFLWIRWILKVRF